MLQLMFIVLLCLFCLKVVIAGRPRLVNPGNVLSKAEGGDDGGGGMMPVYAPGKMVLQIRYCGG